MEQDGRQPEGTGDGDRTRPSLTRLKLEGYKSFRSEEIDFGHVTVLLGANGAGKSNLASFFQMLGFLCTGALQLFIGRSGRSDSLLFGGRKMTPQMRAEIVFEGRDHATGRETTTTYTMRLGDASPDTLIFQEERASYHRSDFPTPQDIPLGAGQQESLLLDNEAATCRVLLRLLRECRSYHFHDTSSSADIRRHHYIGDGRYLRSDAGNLAACLHRLGQTRPDSYRRIVDTVRLVLPAFADFSLAPSTTNEQEIVLEWREKEAEVGTGTKCHRPNPDALAEWLEEYSLGELWEKNHLAPPPLAAPVRGAESRRDGARGRVPGASKGQP